MAGVLPRDFLNEEELDLFCLRLAYPDIKSVLTEQNGARHLKLRNGKIIPYSDPAGKYSGLHADVKTSLAQIYPLEPARPSTDAGIAPGRKRPYDLLHALYGQDEMQARANLQAARLNGKQLNIARQAAQSFKRAAPRLEELARMPNLKKYLKPDGAFYWRKIAGEPWLSAHSFGIAIDLGANVSPYWRWSGKMPHPLQLSYPSEIARAMEDHGFIWGGKWHEYDLMHFEYRPEILCKSRMLQYMRDHGSFSARRIPHASSSLQSSSKAAPATVR